MNGLARLARWSRHERGHDEGCQTDHNGGIGQVENSSADVTDTDAKEVNHSSVMEQPVHEISETAANDERPPDELGLAPRVVEFEKKENEQPGNTDGKQPKSCCLAQSSSETKESARVLRVQEHYRATHVRVRTQALEELGRETLRRLIARESQKEQRHHEEPPASHAQQTSSITEQRSERFSFVHRSSSKSLRFISRPPP